MLLAVQACTFGNKNVKVASFPSWVSSPQSDTKDTIYGIGSGFSHTEAKEDALRDISGKLITRISSQSKSEVSQFNSSVSRSASQSISTRTIETWLSDYKIVNSEQVDSKLFMQISMSRSDFIKTTASRLKELDDKIKSSMQEAVRKTKLQQLITSKDLRPSIDKARSLVLLLQAAGSNQDTDKYLSYYNEVIKKSNDLLYNVRFHISSSRNLNGFAKHLLTLLHNENISASIAKAKNADAYIHVSGDIKSSYVFSNHISQLVVKIFKIGLIMSLKFNPAS